MPPLIPLRDWSLLEKGYKNEYPLHTIQAGTLIIIFNTSWSMRLTGGLINLDT